MPRRYSSKGATVFERGTETPEIEGVQTAAAETPPPSEVVLETKSIPPGAGEVSEDRKPRRRRKSPPVDAVPEGAGPPVSMDPGSLTMGGLAEKYIAALRDAGKGLGTQFSYSIDLQVAVRHFGAETQVASLTPRKVQNFFESDAVRKTRGGKGKARPTIDKTRRVLRLALEWAAEQGLIAEAPVPKKIAKDGEE